MAEYIGIGYLKKPFGVKGELKVQVKEDYLEDFLRASVIFVKLKGKPVPFFVEEIRFTNIALVKFEDVTDKESATALSSSEILLRHKDLLPEEEKQLEVEGLEFAYLKGFELEEESLGKLGIIQSVEEYPQQEMAVISYQKKEVLIPLNEHFILSIDEKEKIVLLRLPEGLLQI